MNVINKSEIDDRVTKLLNELDITVTISEAIMIHATVERAFNMGIKLAREIDEFERKHAIK